MISAASNAESESDVDDFGLSILQKNVDYSSLTPVREEVKGSDSSTICSCESCDRKGVPDITPQSSDGVQHSSERVPQQLTHQKNSSTIGWLHDLGNIALSLHDTTAGRTFENLLSGVATALIKISSFFHPFVIRQERTLEDVHLPTVAEPPLPETVRENDMAACLQRLEKLESLCNHLVSKPPDMPKEKERLLLQSLDRIKSIEADLERTKEDLQAAAAKRMELVETLEALQHQPSSVRRRLFCS